MRADMQPDGRDARRGSAGECSRVQYALSRALDGELNQEASRAAQRHAAGCSVCCEELRGFVRLFLVAHSLRWRARSGSPPDVVTRDVEGRRLEHRLDAAGRSPELLARLGEDELGGMDAAPRWAREVASMRFEAILDRISGTGGDELRATARGLLACRLLRLLPEHAVRGAVPDHRLWERRLTVLLVEILRDFAGMRESIDPDLCDGICLLEGPWETEEATLEREYEVARRLIPSEPIAPALDESRAASRDAVDWAKRTLADGDLRARLRRSRKR